MATPEQNKARYIREMRATVDEYLTMAPNAEQREQVGAQLNAVIAKAEQAPAGVFQAAAIKGLTAKQLMGQFR